MTSKIPSNTADHLTPQLQIKKRSTGDQAIQIKENEDAAILASKKRLSENDATLLSTDLAQGISRAPDLAQEIHQLSNDSLRLLQ